MSGADSVLSFRVHDDSMPACENCDKHTDGLLSCNVCDCAFCDNCWNKQIAHKKGLLAPGGIPHERTELGIARCIQDVFAHPDGDWAIQRLHDQDRHTIWFGLGHQDHFSEALYLRDYGRYSDLVAEPDVRGPASARKNSLQGRTIAEPHLCHPGLVSFVGQTGAGKSTLIKLLVSASASQTLDSPFPTPIAGVPGSHLPTSADIHLYADPGSIAASKPILYADCEGLSGGTKAPVATSSCFTGHRPSIASINLPEYFGDDRGTERKLKWANNIITSSRSYAVAHLYPRLLFAFSDVIVFVHRNPRTIEDVLDKLVEWAAAVETSSNQPVLPYAILVLNSSENNIDPKLWDVDKSTEDLLESLTDTIDSNATFKKHAELWTTRGMQIQSLGDLIRCYFTALRIVRIPTLGRPNLIFSQAQKLYAEIQTGVSEVQDRKAKLRMLLTALDFQVFFQRALDHFCTELDRPFDFVQASLSEIHPSADFSQNILAIAIALGDSSATPDASILFKKIARLAASCIMLHAVRNHVKGTADRILPKYTDQIDTALAEFCNKHWPCEFRPNKLLLRDLQANWDNNFFFQQADSNELDLRCINVRVGHGSRGHQLKDGRFFATGDYISSFTVETHRKSILDDIYFHLHILMEKLSAHSPAAEAQLESATKLHREETLPRFFSGPDQLAFTGFRNTKFCVGCLFEAAYFTLPCGHSLCRECVVAFGQSKTKTVIEVSHCPLHTQEEHRSNSRRVYVKPDSVGIRILALDDGGVNSIAQVEILKLLEREFQGRLPLQCFFDFIVGEGTGGVLALGLGSRHWAAEDCEKNLLNLLKQSFSHKSHKRMPSILLRERKAGHWKYHSKPLEDSLKELFTEEQRLVDQRPDKLSYSDYGIHVAVRTRSVGAYPIIFSNYVSEYTFTDVKLWESARATMSNRALFKPFVHEKLGPLSIDRARDSNNAVAIAAERIETTFGTKHQPVLDVVLSLGAGTAQDTITSVDPKNNEDDTTWQDYLEAKRAQSFAAATTRLFVELSPAHTVDDLASIAAIQTAAVKQIRLDTVAGVARRLFASLFYVEAEDTAEELVDGRYLISAQILCRLPDGSSEIQEIGELLKEGTFRSSTFFVREEGLESQTLAISNDLIENSLIRRRQFSVPELSVYLTDRYATVSAGIQLASGEEYALSAFPNQLLGRSVALKGRGHESDRAPSRSSSSWTAPSLRHISTLSDLSISTSGE